MTEPKKEYLRFKLSFVIERLNNVKNEADYKARLLKDFETIIADNLDAKEKIVEGTIEAV